MPGSTAKFAMPYPLGTDPISDGDDQIKALAEKIDALFGVTRTANVIKGTSTPFFKSTTWYPVNANVATLNLTAAAVCLVKAITDMQGMTGSGSVQQRIGSDDCTVATWYEGGPTRYEFNSTALLYMPAGATLLTPYVQNFTNTANGYTVNQTRWVVHAFGGTPTWT